MIEALVGWKGYAMSALVSAAVVGTGAWVAQGWRYGEKIAGMERN